MLNDKALHMKLDTQLYDELKQAADDNHMSLASVIRMACSEWLRKGRYDLKYSQPDEFWNALPSMVRQPDKKYYPGKPTILNTNNNLKDKFTLSVKNNIFIAKRNIVDYIWKSAKLEGINVTYPDTDAIYNGFIVSDILVDDIQTINNLKHAWRFVLDTINYPTNYALVCKINQYVGSNLFYNSGTIRTVPVSIGGTSWKPDIPIESQIREELEEVLTIKSKTAKAITLMLYLMRKQMFVDGNKRTAMLAANHAMITGGVGIISIPIDMQRQFHKLLVQYYESNEMDEIKQFVYDNCIDGLDLE